MVHTCSFTREDQFRALEKFDSTAIKKFARAASECIINGPSWYENFDHQISDADQVRQIVENLMIFYLECCENDVSEEKLNQFVKSKRLNSEHAAAVVDEYRHCKPKIRHLYVGANNVLRFHDMQWRLEAKVASRSLPNQKVVPLFSMDFKLGDSSTTGDTRRTSHEILQTDPVTLLRLADSLEKASSETRSRNLRNVRVQLKKCGTLD